MKQLFIEAHSNQSILPALKANLKNLTGKTIGLATTVQHIHEISEAKNILEKEGFKVILAKSQKNVANQGIKANHLGQVLGCDASNSSQKVDSWLYIGTGQFHPIAIALETNVPVYALDPFSKKIEQISAKTWLARKAAKLSKLKDAKKVGIILSTKPGQYKPKLVDKLRKKLEGKETFTFIADLIQSNELLNFPDIDIWINTACPRLVDDKWPKTMINADWLL